MEGVKMTKHRVLSIEDFKDTKFTWNFECPICFLYWTELKEEVQEITCERKICSFCKDKKFALEELIDRQINVINQARVHNFPKLVTNIWKYIKKKKDDI
jgi:hypothetical protein